MGETAPGTGFIHFSSSRLGETKPSNKMAGVVAVGFFGFWLFVFFFPFRQEEYRKLISSLRMR